MSNKEDWEELEKWNQENIEKNKEKYGVDFSNISIEKENNKISRVIKVFKWIINSFKTIGILGIIVALCVVGIVIYVLYDSINLQINIPVASTLESMHNIKLETISQETDERGNGKYIFKIRDNGDLKFTAIKKYGDLTEDYIAQSHKFYFELWNSINKKFFTVKEHIDNDMLYYETYIENFDDVEKATNGIIEFVQFCGENFRASWNIYLKINDKRIYPYNSNKMTAEDAMKNAKDEYEKIFN